MILLLLMVRLIVPVVIWAERRQSSIDVHEFHMSFFSYGTLFSLNTEHVMCGQNSVKDMYSLGLKCCKAREEEDWDMSSP